MQLSNEELGNILVAQGYLSKEELGKTLAEAQQRDVQLQVVLFEHHIITSDLLENALAEHYHLPLFDLRKNLPSRETIAMLPEEFARTFSAIVVAATPKEVTVATSDPSTPRLAEAVLLNLNQPTLIPLPDKNAPPAPPKKKRFAPGERAALPPPEIKLVYVPRDLVHAYFAQYHKSLSSLIKNLETEKRNDDDAPEILEKIIEEALDVRASDIHIEPQGKDVLIRMRVDGVMHEASRLKKEFYETLVNRIKIAANLRIDEHFSPQDGTIRFQTKTINPMDIRISIIPVVDGEKVAMRLLSEYVRDLSLNDLGFSDANRTVLEKAAHKPFGMIIATGPTGAGKSTSLYGLIKLRNHPDVNISTIEDPVEYKVPGINHIQVNAQTGLTFAKGLRALMRQDPDIILVGEIRDDETAGIAVNAALTGHLVFSTLHSNDAATAIPRLLEMDVEPFLLASTVEVIIAQRLMRRVCPSCRFSYDIHPTDARALFRGAQYYFSGNEPVRFYRGKGCATCSNTGYTGRIAIHEVLIVNKAIEELAVARANSSDLLMQARLNGMSTMFEDGLEKVRIGLSTIEELLRVANPPDEITKRK